MKISTREMILVALFSALMVVGAYIRIPFPLVPLTFQPFFCAFAGILLGSRLGLLSQVIYIVMGLIGLPVFSNGGGIAYIFKPSFGYILGFAIGAYTIGKISEKIKTESLFRRVIALTAGLLVMYGAGIPYTYLILKYYMQKPDVAIIWSSIIPFIVKDFGLFIVIAVVSNKVIPLVRQSQTVA